MLVVGLGNPGKRYAGTPHNVGFRVLDTFAEHTARLARPPEVPAGAAEAPPPAWAPRFDGAVMLTAVDRQEIVLLKPLTYMNRSGESVRKAMSFFEISEESTLVVHDELDLPLGTVKLKRGGGEAGHNGLKSISAEIGTRDYSRLRVGVGRPTSGEVADFLLRPLDDADATKLEGCFGAARDAIQLWARQGMDKAMNWVNRQVAGVPNPEAGPTN
jgi:PTH1 family peptidyl-tRNA hydrolase